MSQKWREHTQYVKGSLFSLPSLSASCFLTLSTGIKENHVIIFSDNYQKGKLHVNSQQLRNAAAALYTSIQCGRPIMLYFLGSLLAFIFYFFLFFKYKKKKAFDVILCVWWVSVPETKHVIILQRKRNWVLQIQHACRRDSAHLSCVTTCSVSGLVVTRCEALFHLY